MFSDLDDRNKYKFDEYDGMTKSLSSPSAEQDFVYDFGSSPPNSSDFETADYNMISLDEDIMMSHYGKFDFEIHPQLFNLVSPNDILPVETSVSLDSPTDPFIRTDSGSIFSTSFPGINDIPEDIPVVSDRATSPMPESLEPMCDPADQFLSDKIISEITNQSNLIDLIDFSYFSNEPVSNSNSNDSTNMCQKTYHPDYDHCYSKINENKEDLWPSIGSPDDSSGSSSEEVDVVTVTEEIQTPFVPKVQVPFRKRQKRGQKSQKTKKNSFSPKSFTAAMKRNMTRITAVRRTYRRKINNSVETTPSNSLPSSAPSSRCSSDVEDAGKRANHNSSERKRREVLRTALQTLRINCPSVANNVKAPKVQILTSATQYIKELKLRDQESVAIKKNLRRKRKSLEIKLKLLAAELNLCN